MYDFFLLLFCILNVRNTRERRYTCLRVIVIIIIIIINVIRRHYRRLVKAAVEG